MTQEEIDNRVIDVIFNENEILHVQEPNTNGIKGISIMQEFIRRPIAKVKRTLSYDGYDLTKINEYEQELINQNQIE
ncbi:hypothetical protein [Mesonia mobilis]|uniref:hypothetical protein n=1 Tax=Mesonia mobilis TaxID=369791 RepID=UPI0024BA49CC|nr:hypothetical protein [Mesonia mobilis]